MRALDLFTKSIGAIAMLSALAGCGPSRADRTRSPYTPVSEAYTLLNKGQSARAIQLLEQVLSSEPANAEARFLLASAYMGESGINVFSLHDAFQDVLFSKSLSDVFFSGAKAPDAPGPLSGTPLPAGKKEGSDTSVERLFQNIDESLNNFRRVSLIFERFPRVRENLWPLMEQALWNLDKVPLEPQVRIYRMFIRLIYFKEVLVTKIIRDPSFGTRQWACRIELESFERSLHWLSETMGRVSEDFVAVYPGQASPFDRAQVIFNALESELETLEQSAPAGSATGASLAQSKLREALRCDSLSAI